MNRSTEKPFWDADPPLPPGVKPLKAFRIFVLNQVIGFNAWTLLIIGLEAGFSSRTFHISVAIWAMPFLVAGLLFLANFLKLVPFARLFSWAGYMSMRVIFGSFTVLGLGLAYGSEAFTICLWMTILGIAGIELLVWLNVSRFSDEKIIRIMADDLSPVAANGSFYLKTYGPSVSGKDMWIRGKTDYMLFSAFAAIAPLLLALGITGRGDSLAGPTMVSIGLLIYFLARGTWAGQYALHRAIRLRLAGVF